MKNTLLYLKSFLQKTNIISKIIYINIGIFVLGHIFNTLSYLFLSPGNLLFDILSLPSNFKEFIFKPWTLLTYGFVHNGFIHLFFNLIVLHYVGKLFIEYLTEKQLLIFYIGGTIVGGIIYLVSFSFFPIFKAIHANLVGASSGIMAIFIGIATYIPHYQIKIKFVGFVKIWVLVGIFLLLDLIQIPVDNAGGHLAHLGGALYGYVAILNLKGVFSKFFNIKITFTKKDKNQKKIDIILNKIAQSGYGALSKEEKAFLFKHSKNKP